MNLYHTEGRNFRAGYLRSLCSPCKARAREGLEALCDVNRKMEIIFVFSFLKYNKRHSLEKQKKNKE